MSAPHRCLICGSLNEPYASRCGCGAAIDVTAEESRRALARRVRTAAWTLVLWLLVTIALVGIAVAVIADGRGSSGGGARLFLAAIVGAAVAFAACIREARTLVRARLNLAAVPALPRAELRRRS